MEKLQLSLLHIQELVPGCFEGLPNLRHLIIKYNQIGEIYEGVFNKLPLTLLDLEGNGISYLDANAFDDLPNMKEIRLGKNNIARINKNWFFNCPNLFKVSVEENSISLVQKKAFKQLEPHGHLLLNLSGNQIEKVQRRAFGNFKRHGYFDLSDNKISSLPGNLFGVNNRLGGRYVLDLRGNAIACLSKQVYAELFSNCKRVFMQRNPITCECSNEIEKFFLKRGNGVEISYEIDDSCASLRNKNRY